MKGRLAVLVAVGTLACGSPTSHSPFTALVGAGWSFRGCTGACRGELDLNGGEVTYRRLNQTGSEVFLENGGRLTEVGERRLGALASEVPSGLAESYGCPDCDCPICVDGGAAFIALVGSESTHRIAYEYGDPPPELEELQTIAYSIMDALSQCLSTPEVVPGPDCDPWVVTPSPFTDVVHAGWSFGMCAGPCRGELGHQEGGLTYRLLDRTGGEVLYENHGRLSEVGQARLGTLAAGVPGGMAHRYGCPDCADGGAAFITLVGGDGEQRVVYEFYFPPGELRTLHVFLHSVMGALRACSNVPEVVLDPGCIPMPASSAGR